MKIGITVAMHWSDEFRPAGNIFIKKLVNSINDVITCDKIIYVVDNASQYPSDILTYSNVKYFTRHQMASNSKLIQILVTFARHLNDYNRLISENGIAKLVSRFLECIRSFYSGAI